VHTASYWTQADDLILCQLCPHLCRIKPGQVGRCGVRRNAAGVLVAETYGLISSLALDPIEKKPLFHVKPGTGILSLGSAGCNFRCSFCQNWSISQKRPPLSALSSAELIREAQSAGAVGIAYTYNEPLMNYEYVLECARAARDQGLLNVLVTNGYLNPAPRDELLPWIDALNIDLKGIRPEFYRRFCGAKLEPVQEFIRTAVGRCYVELTHLIVTGGNDNEQDLQALVDWVASVSPEIPLHFSRYFPQYHWDQPPTDVAWLKRAWEIGRAKLKWVYVGNVPGQDDSTRCPDCGELLIERRGYQVGSVHIQNSRCPKCQRKVPGMF
jgi:pyruvate formate lyase activating enzyme